MHHLAYGNTTLNLDVAAEVLAAPTVTEFGPTLDQALRELQEYMAKASKIVIAIPDPTRPAAHQRVFPKLLPLLQGKELTIIVACGAHSAPALEYLQEIKERAPLAQVIVHDCDHSPLTYLGTTSSQTPVWVNAALIEADVAIGIGSVAIHPFAGFSGGPKVFVPGCAGRVTITANHSLLTNKQAGPSLLRDNPVYQDLIEATSLLNNLFIINEALSPQGQVLGYYAGIISAVHAKAASLALFAAAIFIPKPYELVIASCGGYPRDINLYQAIKALDMAAMACEDGGDLILLAECKSGVGSELYQQWALRSFKEQEHMVLHEFMVGAHKAYLASRVLQRLNKAVLVSNLPRDLVEQMGFRAAADIKEALMITQAHQRKHIAIIPFGTTTLPLIQKSEETK